MASSRSSNNDGNTEPPQQARSSSSSAVPAVAPEPSSSVGAAATTAPPTLEIPSGSDDAPLTPHQIAARYERQGVKTEPEEKTELADDEEAPLPPAQIDANAKRNEDTDHPERGGTSPSNFMGTAAVNELTPPRPFNPAAVVGDDDALKKAAAAAPPAAQTEPPIDQRIRRPSTMDEEESIMIPPEDDEVGIATSRQRDSFELRSTPNRRVNAQRPPTRTREERGSEIRVVAWAVTDDTETDEERDEEEEPTIPLYHAIQVQVTWWKKFRRYIIGGMSLLLIGMAVVIGVLVGRSEPESSQSTLQPSSPPSPAKVSTP